MIFATADATLVSCRQSRGGLRVFATTKQRLRAQEQLRRRVQARLGAEIPGKVAAAVAAGKASTHVNWIVFIVVVVVAIVGIWTGACIWRRKYLKKKDRLYELGKGLPSTVAVNTQGNLVGARESTISNGGPGVFMSGSGGAGGRR
ncbi:hypothetical protein NPX13_g377 [Xylaria arbuscula]|uniref:Uncharacterized protein n=1 Tax=Xylaria arbuscula TaxID=114810 RepID=A0A9W8TRZ1_9PEZI|nr:hypothetical protein NPX13_g377 [Xylaria arbuscula]